MKLYITPEARQRLDLYVDSTREEISGLGAVQKVGERLIVTDIYLIKQESSGASTDLDPNGVAEFLGEYIGLGLDPQELKLWWHSHGSMAAFWSGTDDATAKSFANGWMLSLVINNKSEYKCRLDVYDPIHLTLDNIDVVVSCPIASEELKKEIAAEVKEKVKRHKYGSKVYRWREGKMVEDSELDDDDGYPSSWRGYTPSGSYQAPSPSVGLPDSRMPTGQQGFTRDVKDTVTEAVINNYNRGGNGGGG